MDSFSLSDALRALDALVDWERRERSAMHVDTRPVRDLLKRLGHPERRFRTVHVAGTKGKGSVCALVEAGLRRAGHVTGRYASPHVERVNERIVLNGREIGDEALAGSLFDALAARRDAVAAGTEGRDASWFDLWTAAAFMCFAKHHVAWAVVECGLGGLRDSTNVLDSDVAVLTNVDLEHTALLGDSREAIAREKLGILRPGRTLITGVSRDTPLGRLVGDVARSQGVRVVHSETKHRASLLSKNIRIADDVLALLQAPRLNAAAIEDARLPGRQETFFVPRQPQGASGSEVPVVLDGAHVAASLSAVLCDLRRDPRIQGPCTVVMGLGADKDMDRMLAALLSLKDRGVLVITTASRQGPPVRSPAELAREARRQGLPAFDIEDPHKALRQAIGGAYRGSTAGWVLVTGSLHVIGAVRPHLRELCHRPCAMPVALAA